MNTIDERLLSCRQEADNYLCNDGSLLPKIRRKQWLGEFKKQTRRARACCRGDWRAVCARNFPCQCGDEPAREDGLQTAHLSRTKQTDQSTEFVDTIAARDARIAELETERNTWRDACVNTTKERQELYGRVRDTDTALRTALTTLEAADGAWATDEPFFRTYDAEMWGGKQYNASGA